MATEMEIIAALYACVAPKGLYVFSTSKNKQHDIV